MRIRLDLPKTVLFNYQIIARVTDMNHGGHVGNDRFLSFAQEARSAWFQSLGYHEMDVEGCNVILADAALQFLGEVFAFDELDVTLYLGDVHKYGMDLYYALVVKGKEVARLKTAMLFRSNDTQELCPPPEALMTKL